MERNPLASRYLQRQRQRQRQQQRQRPETSEINRAECLHKLMTEFAMSYSDAIDHFAQLYHVYLTYTPNCPFIEFLDVITRIFC